MRLQVKIYLVTLLSLILIVFLNEFNLHELNGLYPSKQGLITSADEASYFAPAENFLEHQIWKDNSEGPSSYFTRTPGYGTIYLICKLIAGSSAFALLKIIQILLFGGSILLLAKIMQLLKFKGTFLLIVLSIYAFLPSFSGFVYYTLTESILPFFFLWWILSTFRANEKEFISLSLILSGAFLIMFRPQLIIFPLIFLAYHIFRRNKIALSMLLMFVPFIIWNVRTFSIAGEWLGVHPIYSSKNSSMYRPPHKELTELFRVWEYDGERFHSVTSILSRDTTNATLEEAIGLIPGKYKVECKPIFTSFQKLCFQQNHELKEKAKEGLIVGEKQLCEDINATRTKFIKEIPADYYLKTPAKSFIKLFKTSMMNLFVFQETWKDTVLIKILKYISFGIIICGLLSSMILIFSKVNTEMRLLSLGILCSVFYLVYMQRLNEERYIAPILMLFLLNTAISGKMIFEKIKMVIQRMTINQKV